MRFINKTYLLLVVLITTGVFNLLLLFTIQQESIDESFSLIIVNDLKIDITNIATFASSIAAGHEADRILLQQKIDKIASKFQLLEDGGSIDGKKVTPVPPLVKANFIHSYDLWTGYKTIAETIKTEPVFEPEVKESLTYVLNKNADLIILHKQLVDELSNLDRDYRRHQEIANDFLRIVENMNTDVLLISLGDDAVRSSLKENRLTYDINLKKLLGTSLDDLSINGRHIEDESLLPLPQKNLFVLKQIEPLWEAMRYRILKIESNSLISEKFGSSLRELNQDRIILIQSFDELLESWNYQIDQQIAQRQTVLGTVIIINIAIFAGVIFALRTSLSPLQKITTALINVKDGKYEEVVHNSKDEIGDLINTFNVMSETIKKREEEAKKIDKNKDEFLAMITHELKTPLVPIQGCTDILLTENFGKLNKNQKERLNLIKESSTSLLQLISDLLDVQILELKKMRMKMINNSTYSIISDAIKIMLPKTENTKIKMSHIKTTDINIVCDKDRLVQVLTNLIKNSLASVNPNNGVIEIFVTDFIDKIQFTVKDNGHGITQESISRLFVKFYQANSTLTREKGGSGLGLSICKGIVDAHNGHIWVEQKPNDVRFCFTIPKNIPKSS